MSPAGCNREPAGDSLYSVLHAQHGFYSRRSGHGRYKDAATVSRKIEHIGTSRLLEQFLKEFVNRTESRDRKSQHK